MYTVDDSQDCSIRLSTMTGRRVFPEYSQVVPAHPLLPYPHRFGDNERPVVTGWGEVLPPRQFSRKQLALLGRYAVRPPIDVPESVITLATYLVPKLTFGERYGCWLLPLAAEHDTAPNGSRRARYPTITIKALGFDKQLAHRATISVFGGQSLEGVRRTHIDHLCRVHACCNPYHLEAVPAAENTRRGFEARRHTDQPSLVQVPPDETLTYEQLATVMAMMKEG